MSTSTHPKTFADLYSALLADMRADTTSTAVTAHAKRYINTALHEMHATRRERFQWAERDAVLTTRASYTTGTISATQGSTTLTGTSTAWTTADAWGTANARAGGKIVIAGSTDVYEVASVDAATTITLTEKFVSDDVTDETYAYFEDEFALDSDFLRPLDIRFFDQNRTLPLIGRRDFRARYPRNNIPGTPKAAAILDKPFDGSVTPVRKIVLAPPPQYARLIPYAFITNKLAVDSTGTELAEMSSDTDEPIVPLSLRHLILWYASANWYRDRNDDQRAEAKLAQYFDLYQRVLSDQEVGQQRPQLRPVVAPYVRSARRPYRSGGTRYSTGSAFDELRDL